jgi:phage-related holin
MNLKLKLLPLPDFAMKVFTALAVFIAPIKSIMIAVSILIVADAITGIWASQKKGEPFSSRKFFASITKLLIYLFLIMVSQIVELHLISQIPFVQLSVYFIVFYEFSSFLENVGVITGHDVFAFFKEQLLKLKSTRK